MLCPLSKCCHLTTGTIKSVFHPILAIALLTIGQTCLAQSLSNEVIAVDGGTHIANQISLDWTLGEPAVETVRSGKQQFTQGFHQPYLMVNKELKLPETPSVQLRVYPNPFSATLSIDFLSPPDIQYIVSVSNMLGKEIIHSRLDHQSQDLSMRHLPSGQFVLHIVGEDGVKIYSGIVTKI